MRVLNKEQVKYAFTDYSFKCFNYIVEEAYSKLSKEELKDRNKENDLNKLISFELNLRTILMELILEFETTLNRKFCDYTKEMIINDPKYLFNKKFMSKEKEDIVKYNDLIRDIYKALNRAGKIPNEHYQTGLEIEQIINGPFANYDIDLETVLYFSDYGTLIKIIELTDHMYIQLFEKQFISCKYHTNLDRFYLILLNNTKEIRNRLAHSMQLLSNHIEEKLNYDKIAESLDSKNKGIYIHESGFLNTIAFCINELHEDSQEYYRNKIRELASINQELISFYGEYINIKTSIQFI